MNNPFLCYCLLFDKKNVSEYPLKLIADQNSTLLDLKEALYENYGFLTNNQIWIFYFDVMKDDFCLKQILANSNKDTQIMDGNLFHVYLVTEEELNDFNIIDICNEAMSKLQQPKYYLSIKQILDAPIEVKPKLHSKAPRSTILQNIPDPPVLEPTHQQWDCPNCTLKNNVLLNKCDCCGKERPK